MQMRTTTKGCRACRACREILLLLLSSVCQADDDEGTRLRTKLQDAISNPATRFRNLTLRTGATPTSDQQAVPSLFGDLAESSHRSLQSEANGSGGSSVYPFALSEKFLYFARNGDWNAGAKHKMGSLACEVGEAMYLNRTLVVDAMWLVSPSHNNGKASYQNITLYIDLNKMQKFVKVILLEEFLTKWKAWDSHYPDSPIPALQATISNPLSRAVRNETATIIQRNPARMAPYGFVLCKSQKDVAPAYGAIRTAPQLLEMASEISTTIGWNYTVLHIRRGDKAAHWWTWPHVDNDTQPGHIMQVLKERNILPGATLYIATDESDPHFFDPMKALYKVYQLSDFGHLWAPHSKWWNHSQSLLPPGTSFEPDGDMQGLVDYDVTNHANLKMDTFYDFTSDPYNGIHGAKAP